MYVDIIMCGYLCFVVTVEIGRNLHNEQKPFSSHVGLLSWL